MLMHEWIWVDAKTVWESEAEERGEARADSRWQSIVKGKDAKLADKDAILAELRARLDKN